MSMTRNLFGLALVAVAGTAVSADPATFDATTTIEKAKVDGVRTVQANGANPTGLRETAVFAYDTQTCADCNWGLNISWADPECFVDGGVDCPGYIYLLVLATADYPAGSPPYDPLVYDDGAGNMWVTDIMFDDYQADDGLWGDINMLMPMVAFSSQAWTYNAFDGQPRLYVYDQLLISADGATFYGGWEWELQGDDPTDFNILWTITAGTLDAPLDPADTFEVGYEGIITSDYRQDLMDSDDGGAWNVFLGGNLADFSFPDPPSLYAAGFNDPESWAAGGVEDPNNDENWDGEPGLSYLDILNTGFLIDWAFVDDVNNPTFELPHGIPGAIGIQSGPGCEGDLNGDGKTDQSDLGILLSSYLVDDGGDLNGDGVTDQSDLGILLGDFNCGV